MYSNFVSIKDLKKMLRKNNSFTTAKTMFYVSLGFERKSWITSGII